MYEIMGYEGRYAITDDGRVWSYPKYNRRKGMFLKPVVASSGYRVYGLRKGSRVVVVSEHRLLAEMWFGEDKIRKMSVHHINGVKTDNRKENLMLIEQREHARHHGHERGCEVVELTCDQCGIVFPKPMSYVRDKKKRGNKHMFCSHKCYGLHKRL